MLVEQLLQHGVGEGVGGAVDLAHGEAGAGHETGALGDVIDPLQKGLGLPDVPGADHVDEAGAGLDHVGGQSAGVGDGVMDAGLGGHMLSEELDADVHQFRCIQGGPAVPGVAGGMGTEALEPVLHLDAGGIGAHGDLVGVAGVPAEGGIQVPEHAVTGHEGLACAAFLTGAAVEDHGAPELAGGDGFLDGDGGAQRGGAQQMMSAALTAAVGVDRLPLQSAGLLGKAGEGVIFAQDADPGAAGTEDTGEGGGDAAEVFLNGETQLGQQFHISGGGLVFQQGQLRVLPDLVTEGGDGGGILVDDVVKLLVFHKDTSFYEI